MKEVRLDGNSQTLRHILSTTIRKLSALGLVFADRHSDVRLGSHVKLSKNRLRAQYLSDNAICSYVRVAVEDRLAGNAFACRWSYKNTNVCWLTQLVVHSDFRECGLAASLLNQLRQDDDAIYGLMSSHPAAWLVAAKAFGSTRAYGSVILKL